VIHQVSLVGLPALLVLLQHLQFFTKVRNLITSLYVRPNIQPMTSLHHADMVHGSTIINSSTVNTATTTGTQTVTLHLD